MGMRKEQLLTASMNGSAPPSWVIIWYSVDFHASITDVSTTDEWSIAGTISHSHRT